jgi:sphingolipid delta-4 desaturase
MNSTSRLQYVHVNYPEPHLARMRQILAAHPQVKSLFGPTPSTFFIVVAVVAAQLGISLAMPSLPWWAVFVAGYTIGAIANHALFVLIHDCTHNLVFKTSRANSWLQIFANLPIIFPSAMSFRVYHIKHHLYQGDMTLDADLPRPFEAKLVGNSFLGKATWFLFFFVSQITRVPYLKSIRMFDRWIVTNWVIELSFLAALTYWAGPKAFGYLAISSIFSVGLHPLGARWIQEHYVVHEKQETYSYYGPLNTVALNVGYHNEHHDFMNVAWSRLPKVRAMAPEFYDTLYWHRSWSKLLWRFLSDPQLSLYSRVIREGRPAKVTAAAEPGLVLERRAQAESTSAAAPVN